MGNFHIEFDPPRCLEVVLACTGNPHVEVALGYPGILFHYVTGSQCEVLVHHQNGVEIYFHCLAEREMPEEKQVVGYT